MSINIPEGMTKTFLWHLPVVRWGRGLALWQVWLWWSFAYCLIRPYLLWRAERCKQSYEESKRELMGK